MAEEEKFLQEIKEPKAHTDDPHDSATKEALDGYIEIDNFKPGGIGQSKTINVKKVIIKNGEKVFVDEELPRDK
tara:strand:+ start:320 stop:541 length:222 start_codon:yes stop_codon:yes gene_type:complete